MLLAPFSTDCSSGNYLVVFTIYRWFFSTTKHRQGKTIRISVAYLTRSLSQGWFGNSAILSGRQIPSCLRSDSATSLLVMSNGCNLSRKYPSHKRICWKQEKKGKGFSPQFIFPRKKKSFPKALKRLLTLHCSSQAHLPTPRPMTGKEKWFI